MRRAVTNMLALALALVAGTLVIGWWSVPVIAALWTFVIRRPGAALTASLAGALAWGILLLWISARGPLNAVDGMLASIMGLPPKSLIGLALVYAALLAGAPALLVAALRPPSSLSSRST